MTTWNIQEPAPLQSSALHVLVKREEPNPAEDFHLALARMVALASVR